MESAAKRLRKWAENNDFYASSVLGNRLRLRLKCADAVRKTAASLEYNGREALAKRLERGFKDLQARCAAMDTAIESSCKTEEEFLVLDAVKRGIVTVANALAELLEMAETSVTPTLPTEDRTEATTKQTQERIPPKDEWISLSKSGRLLGVNPGTVSRLISKGLVKDNGQKGRKRKVSKTSVLIEKERRDNLELMNMADELKVDSARIKDDRY